MEEFEQMTGRKVLCNKPLPEPMLLETLVKSTVETGALIAHTSADSVFQVAAYEDVVSPEKLYEYCRMRARFFRGEHDAVSGILLVLLRERAIIAHFSPS